MYPDYLRTDDLVHRNESSPAAPGGRASEERLTATDEECVNFFRAPLENISPEVLNDVDQWRAFLLNSGYLPAHVNRMTAISYLLAGTQLKDASAGIGLLPQMRYLITELTQRFLYDDFRYVEEKPPFPSDPEGWAQEAEDYRGRITGWLQSFGETLFKEKPKVPVRLTQLIQEGFLTSLTRAEASGLLKRALEMKRRNGEESIPNLAIFRLSASRPGWGVLQTTLGSESGEETSYAFQEDEFLSYSQEWHHYLLIKTDVTKKWGQWWIDCFADIKKVLSLCGVERHKYLELQRSEYEECYPSTQNEKG